MWVLRDRWVGKERSHEVICYVHAVLLQLEQDPQCRDSKWLQTGLDAVGII